MFLMLVPGLIQGFLTLNPNKSEPVLRGEDLLDVLMGLLHN